MTYLQAQDYLNSFVNYERLKSFPYRSRFKLARVRRLLQFLGQPQEALRIIHIAGTKGKGSTCVFTAHILQQAGFKVGLYTSPHLVDLRERIRIVQSSKCKVQSVKCKNKKDEDKISQKDFARLIASIKPHTEKLRKTKLGRLSYFEVLTCLALAYFKEQQCDFVVLETGIGGRLDATNVVNSLVCAITPISYDHTKVLGKTLARIAAEKAGVIKCKVQSSKCKVKRGGIVVIAPQRPAAMKIIKKRAKECNARLIEIGKAIQIKKGPAGTNWQSFDLKGVFNQYPRLKIKLLGQHQMINAAVAVGCAEALRDYGIKIGVEAVRTGLKKAFWPGRLHVIWRQPRVVLDGAQNMASALALKEAVDKLFSYRKLILVFAACQDKDVRGMLRELVPLASRIILTKFQNPRAMPPEAMKALISTNAKPVMLAEDSTRALRMAKQEAKRKDLILVCGSLFLVGEVLDNER